jgi:hypothetical protein
MLFQGPVGKNGISPVASSTASAAHVRTMRKGSTDHLALNVDLESGSLINHEETDEDKGLHSTASFSWIEVSWIENSILYHFL